MSKIIFYPAKNVYTNRNTEENEIFPELTIHLQTIDTILLLFNSAEEMVLITAMKHLTEFARKDDANIKLLKEKNVLEIMLQKEFYRHHTNVIVKRLSLCLAAIITETLNCLVDLEPAKILEIVQKCLVYYKNADDDYCFEYLSVMMNKCLDDPQAVKLVLADKIFVEKYFTTIVKSLNPDAILHSFELLEKMLKVQCFKDMQDFMALTTFPINRVLCELSNEFLDIRSAALKITRIVILDNSLKNPFYDNELRMKFVLEQLTKLFCQKFISEEMFLIVDVLAAAMRNKDMAVLFFELNLFDKYLNYINNDNMEFDAICDALLVATESAHHYELLPRLVFAKITDKFLNCLLAAYNTPPCHIVEGLNRMLQSTQALNYIVESYDRGLLAKLLKLLPNPGVNIKTREQVANLLRNLLADPFHKTASEMLELRLTYVLADIFAQHRDQHSIDLLYPLLGIMETLAGNADYREKICENDLLITNLGVLLKKSFSTAILQHKIFRCLCTIVDQESVRLVLLNSHICSSIKRALKSSSDLVKSSVTNFIMQTTRFPEFLKAYIELGVLEVLIMHQKHSLCVVPTWNAVTESILSKNPTMKFCIRNHLSFTDITVNNDFLVSKQKFYDFRIFQSILENEVSPIQPVLIVNFNRSKTPDDSIVKVSVDCLSHADGDDKLEREEWCYCRTPGDEFLPKYLEEVNGLFETEGLTVNSENLKGAIEIDNISKRCKIIAQVVARVLGNNLKCLDLNSTEECSEHTVKSHLKDLAKELHCSFIPLGRVHTGCQFERAVLFKTLADQVGLPSTLERGVDGQLLFNEVPLPLDSDKNTMQFIPWRLLRPTHIVDLMYNVGELYPINSRQALKYLRFY